MGSYQYSESLPSYKYWKKDTGEEMAKWCLWEMAHLSTAWNIISSCQISSHLIKIIATFIVIINSVIFAGTITGLHLGEPDLASNGSDFWIRSNVNHCTWENHSQSSLIVITIFIALMLLTFCSPAQIFLAFILGTRQIVREKILLCFRTWTFVAASAEIK